MSNCKYITAQKRFYCISVNIIIESTSLTGLGKRFQIEDDTGTFSVAANTMDKSSVFIARGNSECPEKCLQNMRPQMRKFAVPFLYLQQSTNILTRRLTV